MSKIKQLFSLLNRAVNPLGNALTPSVLSGLAAVFISIVVVAGVIGMATYEGSELQFIRNAQTSEAALVNYESVSRDINSGGLVSNIPLFIFWCGVGLIVYFFASGVFGFSQRFIEFERELGYVNANRAAQVRTAAFGTILRLAMLVIWLAYVQFTLHTLLPYVIALSVAAAGGYGWVLGALYAAGAILLLALAIHLHVVLLRLTLLRTRVFGR